LAGGRIDNPKASARLVLELPLALRIASRDERSYLLGEREASGM
jgi:hypothetical protein